MLIGGGNGLHVSEGAGAADRQVAGRERQARSGARIARWKRERKFRLLLPVDHVLAESPNSTATQDHRHRAHARQQDGARHRPANGRSYSATKSARRAPSCGTGRWACSKCRIRAGHAGDRQRCGGGHSHGATSIVGGGDSVAAVEQAGVASTDFAHLDGRRRFARISRGRQAARRGSAHQRTALGSAPKCASRRRSECDARSSPAIGRCTRRRRRRALFSRRSSPLVANATHCDIVIAPPFTAHRRSRRSGARQRHLHRGAELRLGTPKAHSPAKFPRA